MKNLPAAVAAGLLLAGATGLAAAERPFRMGFTPFPYDVGVEAAEWTYDTVLSHGDLIAHHLDTGVPWQEALERRPYPALVENELGGRMVRTPAGTTIYLAATPISTLRDGLAQYWTDAGPAPLPREWARRGFDHPKVVRAYLRYCLDLIERFDPQYMAYAVEVDILHANDPRAFEEFAVLARKVYRKIKRRHPDLTLFFTITLGQPGHWPRIREAVRPLLPYTDLLALSTYPYLVVEWGGDPARIDDDWFAKIRELDPDKPVAVAETGYAAETLTFDTLGITISGRRAWQKRYLARLLREMKRMDAVFLIWFTSVDYDELWKLMEEAGVSELFKAWRDTGIYDEDLELRPAGRLWKRWLKRDLASASR